MRRMIAALVMATLAVVALPRYAGAVDGKRPDGPNPERMFNRLDANHDGVITPDEVPAGMPEHMRHLLLQTIEKHGGKLTKQQLTEAIAARHGGPRPEGPGPRSAHPGPQMTAHFPPKGPGPGPNVSCPAAKGPCPMAKAPGPRPDGHAAGNTNETGTLVVNGTLIINGGTVIINSGTLIVGGQAGALKGPALPGRPIARPMGAIATPPTLNARVLFSRLDTNKDGKLSFDEFAVGVRHLQSFLATRMGEMKRPLSDGMRAFREKWGQFQRQSGRPGMGPMGQHPGMGPMGQHPGMGPMGQHPGMGPMMGQPFGMGPMGQHPGMGPMMGQQFGMGPMGQHPGMGPMMGQPFGMGPMGQHPGMGPMGMMMGPFGGHQGPPDGKMHVRVFKDAEGGTRVLVSKVSDGEKHGVKKPGPVACSKCGAKTPEACTCGKKHEAKKCEAKKCAAEKPTAGYRSIEARLTALETQQAEILKLLRSVTKSDHQRGGRGPHHGEH